MTLSETVAEMRRLADDAAEWQKKWASSPRMEAMYGAQRATYLACARMVEDMLSDPSAPGVAERETQRPVRVVPVED